MEPSVSPNPEGFVHLHVHSSYSRGWGVSGVATLCRAAAALGMSRIALTDTNGLYGLHGFLEAARDAGILPLAGSALETARHRAVALVRTKEGYENLCALLSDIHCRRDPDLVQGLRERRSGLILLSDDLPLLKALKREGTEDLYVEMSPGYGMARAYAFSRKSGLPPVATHRVYFAAKDDFPLHRILRAVALNTKLSRLGPEDTCREHGFLCAPQWLVDIFPHAPEALENTRRIAEACFSGWDFGAIVFPQFQGMGDAEAFERLLAKTLEGCRRRYGEITPGVRERIDHEMAIIREKGFAHYFLVVADLTQKAGLSCGRGSAAASIVAYALGITHVDPIEHRLFFERFLNPARRDPPDIDVDFPWDTRDRVVDEAFSRYGSRRAALVANHNTFGARSAIREVAKVFGLTDREIGEVTRRIGYGWRLKEVRDRLAGHPRMQGLSFPRPWDAVLAAAARLESHFAHLATHCGGLVVVPDDIRRHCPVEISAKGVQVLQWDKEGVEAAGLVKIDILGNRSLAVIRDALSLVERNYGRRIPYADLDPLQDPETVRIFYKGDTFGVFYFESPATRQVLTQVASGLSFEAYRRMNHFHLNVVVTSIIRPASNQSIQTWISRLHGAPWEPPHPALRPVLEETLGVMVFQEQLSLAAIHLAGFDASEADTLRKVVAKKDRERRLRDFRMRFEAGALARGASPEVITTVWQMMMGFDGYSFCKPHSASYTLVAYKSAFLRAHYPAEFMASVLSNGGGYYTTFAYLSEARRMGLRILGPHINESDIPYVGKGRTLRIGFMQIVSLSLETREAILDERRRQGPFLSLQDFLRRMGTRVRPQEAALLVKAGCFDALSPLPRHRLLWETLCHAHGRDGHATPNLFSAPRIGPADRPLAVRDTCPVETRLRQEQESLGLLYSIHPLERYRHMWAHLAIVRAGDLPCHVGRSVTTLGWQITGKTVQTHTGEPMRFVSFEDTTACYEAVFFPGPYARFCSLFYADRPFLLKGTVQEVRSAITLNVRWAGLLGAPPASSQGYPPPAGGRQA